MEFNKIFIHIEPEKKIALKEPLAQLLTRIATICDPEVTAIRLLQLQTLPGPVQQTP